MYLRKMKVIVCLSVDQSKDRKNGRVRRVSKEGRKLSTPNDRSFNGK